jgi:ABC-2 type transport system permease protein
MAVYKQNYKRYDGQLTARFWRWAILPRYAFQTVFESKMITSFFTCCFVPHIAALIVIYLKYNAGAISNLQIQPLELLQIDGNFFLYLFVAQTYMSFLLVTFVGPGLVAPDLANNAMPLYLSRPFSRREYIAGKLSILMILTSLITWVPGLLLVAVQANEAGLSWLWDHVRVPVAILAGSLVWAFTISLIALALSAWVKMRPAAMFSLFGVFFITAAFGRMANQILDLDPAFGEIIDLNATMRTLWNYLFLGEASYPATFIRGRLADSHLPAWLSPVSLLFFCCVSLFLLVKKIRANEVVR